MEFKLDLKDYTKELLNATNEQIMMGLKAIGTQGEGYAKMECPVDTGRLRNSIANEVKEKTVYIGTNVEYAPKVEFNDNIFHAVGNAHFLRNSITNHTDEYEKTMLAALKSH